MKLFWILLPTSLCAAPVGNPAEPDLVNEGFISLKNNFGVSLRIGYEGDFVSDMRMKQTEQGYGDIDNNQQTTNSGTATLNFLDRIDLFGVFGSSRITANWRFSGLKRTINRVEIETDYRFLWALGARVILYQWGNATLGAGGRYSTFCAPISWLTLNGSLKTTEAENLEWRQWQTNLLFSYKIDLFIPYLGINYLSAQTKLRDFSVPISSSLSDCLHMKNRSSTGLIIGSALTTGKYFMLNIEGRLINEEAFSISGDIKF